MATITLTALPSRSEQHPNRPYTSKVTELLSTCLGSVRGEAKNLDDIRWLVASFGQGVAAKHPTYSFTVLVGVAEGSRKPNGFDAARYNNGLGQEAWMGTVVKDDCLTPDFAA